MNFNWQEFMNGGLAVHCGSKELAEDFLNECRQRDIKVGNNVKVGGDWCYRFVYGEVLFNNIAYYKEYDYEIVEWSKQEQPKTIRNVLENIQEGETYQAVGDRYISCKDGKITIGTDSHSVTFLQNEYFRKVKEVDLATAIKYMKQGGRATCLSNGCEYKIVDGKIKGVILNGDIALTLKQIESKWLIEE